MYICLCFAYNPNQNKQNKTKKHIPSVVTMEMTGDEKRLFSVVSLLCITVSNQFLVQLYCDPRICVPFGLPSSSEKVFDFFEKGHQPSSPASQWVSQLLYYRSCGSRQLRCFSHRLQKSFFRCHFSFLTYFFPHNFLVDGSFSPNQQFLVLCFLLRSFC